VKPSRMKLENVGPVRSATVEFGDLTVLVGPQASGKSVFLQFLKLVADRGAVQEELKRFAFTWRADERTFLALYLGEGMESVWSSDSVVDVDGQQQEIDQLVRGSRSKDPRLFYIPAQRVMSMRDGQTQPFTQFQGSSPYVLRSFSEKVHLLVQNEYGEEAQLFPKTNRLKAEYRQRIAKTVFAGFGLHVDARELRRRIMLKKGETRLPFGSWSAGQREFAPLLLGMYWLLPPGKVSRRDKIDWVVVEEPEMGLHPVAIASFLALVLELLHRDYRVCLSTHSPAVLDLVWALRSLQEHGGREEDVLELLELPRTDPTREVARTALQLDLRTYAFDAEGVATDASSLDPSAEDERVAGWGGLTDFGSRASEIVSRVVRRSEAGK